LTTTLSTPGGSTTPLGSQNPGSGTVNPPDPMDRLCNLLTDLLSTTHQSPRRSPSPNAVAFANPTTFVDDRDRRVKNVAEECKRQEIHFSGKPGENVNKFIIRLNDVFKIYKPHDTELIRIFHAVLSGPAKIHVRDNPNFYSTWDDAKDTLRDTFLTETYDVESKIELLQRKQQPKEPMAEFLSAIKLLNKCLVDPVEEAELILIACKNCHPRYFKRVRGKQFRSLDDIRKIGQDMENQWYEEDLYQELIGRTSRARVSSIDRSPKKDTDVDTSDSEPSKQCYGCGRANKTLRNCKCEKAAQYRARRQGNRSTSPSPRASPVSKRSVRFKESERKRSKSPKKTSDRSRSPSN